MDLVLLVRLIRLAGGMANPSVNLSEARMVEIRGGYCQKSRHIIFYGSLLFPHLPVFVLGCLYSEQL